MAARAVAFPLVFMANESAGFDLCRLSITQESVCQIKVKPV